MKMNNKTNTLIIKANEYTKTITTIPKYKHDFNKNFGVVKPERYKPKDTETEQVHKFFNGFFANIPKIDSPVTLSENSSIFTNKSSSLLDLIINLAATQRYKQDYTVIISLREYFGYSPNNNAIEELKQNLAILYCLSYAPSEYGNLKHFNEIRFITAYGVKNGKLSITLSSKLIDIMQDIKLLPTVKIPNTALRLPTNREQVRIKDFLLNTWRTESSPHKIKKLNVNGGYSKLNFKTLMDHVNYIISKKQLSTKDLALLDSDKITIRHAYLIDKLNRTTRTKLYFIKDLIDNICYNCINVRNLILPNGDKINIINELDLFNTQTKINNDFLRTNLNELFDLTNDDFLKVELEFKGVIDIEMKSKKTKKKNNTKG